MFQLTTGEWENIRSQIVTASDTHNSMRPQFVTASQRKRNITSTPYAFTEQGVSMLSGILRSVKAVEVNIAIMRAFVFMRQYALTHKDLTNKLNELEQQYDKKNKDVYEVLHFLLQKNKTLESQEERPRIGFRK